MYYFYETRHLNLKKVIIIAIISLLIIALITVLAFKKIFSLVNNTPDVQVSDVSTIFYSNDNSISVELSNNLNLKKSNSSLNYLLELKSDKNLNIFIDKKDVLPNKTLLEVIEADKLAYLGTFEASSNVSEIKELSVNNNTACTYSFHYLDKNLNKAFFLQVIWLQIDNHYYVFDVDFPLDELSFYSGVVTSLLSSFKIN